MTTPTGHLIDVDDDPVNAYRYQAVVPQAHDLIDDGDPRQAAALLLWRGEAPCDVSSELLQQEIVIRPTDRRLAGAAGAVPVRPTGRGAGPGTGADPKDQPLTRSISSPPGARDQLAEPRARIGELGIGPGAELREFTLSLPRNDPALVSRTG